MDHEHYEFPPDTCRASRREGATGPGLPRNTTATNFALYELEVLADTIS